MSRRNVQLIFWREVRDQLRDRRTLFMVAVLPLLLYPALGIGMAQMLNTFSEQTRTVVVIGADALPSPPLLDPSADNTRFLAAWFTAPEDADKLRVVTEEMDARSHPNGPTPEEAAFAEEALERRRQIEELGQLSRRLQKLEEQLPTSESPERCRRKSRPSRVRKWKSKPRSTAGSRLALSRC
jgi:sodium transport system permease protein